MWILYSCLSVIFMSSMILLLKWIGDKVSVEMSLGITMFLAGVLFFIHGYVTKTFFQTFTSWKVFTILLICGVLSYIANYFWLKGFLLAPNAAYSLAIFDARTILVMFGVWFFLRGELTFIHLIGVLITFVGIRLITL